MIALILLTLLSVTGAGWADGIEVHRDGTSTYSWHGSTLTKKLSADETLDVFVNGRPPTPEEMGVRQGLKKIEPDLSVTTVTVPDLYQIQIQILSDRTIKMQKQIDELRARLDALPKWVTEDGRMSTTLENRPQSIKPLLEYKIPKNNPPAEE